MQEATDAAATEEHAVATAAEHAAPSPGQILTPSTREAEGPAPEVTHDEHTPARPLREPVETVAGLAAPVVLDMEAAEPRQANTSEGAHNSPSDTLSAPNTLSVAAGPSLAPPLPTPADAAPAASWTRLIESGPAPSRDNVAELLPYVRLALRGAAALALGLVVIVLMLVVLYRWVDPPVSTLMLGQRLGGTPIERRWVPLDRISPHLIKAVILSEDGGFCRHRGVDWTALEEAIGSARGGSTITMQVVKNLFLWPSRSYLRKLIEIPLAYLVELIWPKRRILEIYLNIAEWGDGVFGAEAAARQHFLKSASRLTAEEAALLAVSLPNPIERTAGYPSAGTRRLAARLLVRMTASRASLACVRAPRRLVAGAPLVPGLRLPL